MRVDIPKALRTDTIMRNTQSWLGTFPPFGQLVLLSRDVTLLGPLTIPRPTPVRFPRPERIAPDERSTMDTFCNLCHSSSTGDCTTNGTPDRLVSDQGLRVRA